MLGGTQDNGAQRYTGHPAWEHSALGDGAYAAINGTSDIRKWFESRWYSFPCFRSDTAGTAGSWVQKQTGISTNANWFYPPMVMDPNNSAVLFVGYDKLYRTANSGDSWTATPSMSLVGTGTNITAIAVAPSDSNILYAGLQNGSVFRIVFSMGSWAATNVTNAVLPAVERLLDELRREHPDLRVCQDPPFIDPPLDPRGGEAFIAFVQSALADLSLPSEVQGAAFGTEASSLTRAGIPAVVLGPGSIEQAHADNEWISLEQLNTAVKVYLELMRRPVEKAP
jgi:hypothetical protein